jgi:glyceraldehyde-3-phosphate dehydrogenase (NADP+)
MTRPAQRIRRTAEAPADASAYFVRESAVPPPFRPGRPVEQRRLLLGGDLVPWTGPSVDVFSPIETWTPSGLAPARLGSRPEMGGREALRMLRAARIAFDGGRGAWASSSLENRVRAMEDFAGRLARLKKPLVRILMWEIAKAHPELEDEFDRTIESIARMIDIARTRERAGRVFRREKGILGLIRDEPRGVVLCAGPYNYPLFESFGLIVPALLSGNSVIIKPPRLGVLFFDLLLEALASCFPAGTVQILSGDGRIILEPLMKSGGIDVFAFIGSLAVADRLINLHPRKTRLRTLLGLGAKNAALILPDADLETAVRECLLGALAFNGQRCAALKILFVHEDVRAEFLDRLVSETARVRIGMPWTAGVRITPMADPARLPYLRSLIEDAVGLGARILNPEGGRADRTILFPAVLHPVDPRMKIHREEQFGPLIPVVPFRSSSGPVAYLRSSPFGQQISIFSTDIGTLRPLVEAAAPHVARVNINAKCQRGPDLFPFTGKKDSARGDFSASEILKVFSDRTVVAARDNASGRNLLGKLRTSFGRLDIAGRTKR